MRRFVLVLLLVALVGCGGAEEDDGTGGSGSGDLPDPCTLVDDAILLGYFPEVPEPESGANGPVLNCSWSDANANSVLIQVGPTNVFSKPGTCNGCIDLPYGEEGYASAVPLQATASFVADGVFYSVTTTGMRDDANQIAALGEKVLAAAG